MAEGRLRPLEHTGSPVELNQGGAFDVSKRRRRYIFVVTQAVAQQNLTAIEQAFAHALYLMMAASDTAALRLRSIPDEVQLDIRNSRTMLSQKWDVLNAAERSELASKYASMTGLDFQSQFNLQ